MCKWWLSLIGCAWLAACGGDDCTAEQRVAVQVIVTGAGSEQVDNVTVELTREEECSSFSDRNLGRVFTCHEQGGGVYIVRVYHGEELLRAEEVEVAADACHIKERASIEIDLSDAGAAEG